jgi:hypothetical protein
MRRAPQRRGRSETERRKDRRGDERRGALRNQTGNGRAPFEPSGDERVDDSRSSDPAERPMDIIERHRDNHPTKVRTINGNRSRS